VPEGAYACRTSLPLPLIATRESYAFRVTNDAHPEHGGMRSPMIVSNVAKFSERGRAEADYLTAQPTFAGPAGSLQEAPTSALVVLFR
jgi:hypothetical protein